MDAWAVKADSAYDADDWCPECGAPLRVNWFADCDIGWPDEIECPVCGSTLALEVEWAPTFYIEKKVSQDERT